MKAHYNFYYIYRIIKPLCQRRLPSPTQKNYFLQHKRKQKKEGTKEASKAFMLPCQLGVKSS